MNKPSLLAVSLLLGAVIVAIPSLRGSDSGTQIVAVPEPTQDIVTNPDTSAHGMVGYYVGPFGDRKITVRLEKVIGSTVEGYSVVGGNERAFSGWYKRLPSGDVEMVTREPGDDPTDGVFTLELAAATPMLTGTWTPNNTTRTSVPLILSKRDFRYNPQAGQYSISSTKLLTAADVSNLTAAELRIMRNEMYARHGYSFKLSDMQQHFDKQDWYMPVSTDVTGQLTKLEQTNEALIKRYEQYTATHYDVFGR